MELKMKRTLILVLAIVLLVNVSYSDRSEKKKIKALQETHRLWLQRDVVYIITPVEKKVFLQLESDREREIMIEAFWKARDPNPNTAENEFKTEHYKRLKHANHWLGKEGPGPGWRSAMGRIYIILGQANHEQKFLNTTGMHPTIIWHYSGKSDLGLPNAFNLVFFKRSGIGEFELYSPIKYGPSSLLTNYFGDNQNHRRAYGELYNLEPEVAMTSLTLIAGESQFTDTPQISSEILVAGKIPAAPHKKVNDNYAETILKYKGIVSIENMVNFIENHSLVHMIQQENGEFILHYTIEPKKLSLERYENSLYTNIEINGRINDINNKTIYQFTKKIPVKLSIDQLETIKGKLFSFQDVIPIIGGNYHYNILFSNKVSREFTSLEGDIFVPESNNLQLGQIILANRTKPGADKKYSLKPFLVKGLQLNPSPRNDFNSSDTLHIYFQLYGLTPELQKNGLIEYIIRSDRDKKVRFSKRKAIADYKIKGQFYEALSLKKFSTAYYTVRIAVYDKNKKKILGELADFYVAPMPLSRPWILYPALPANEEAVAANIFGNQYYNKGNFAKAQEFLGKAYYINPMSANFALDFIKALFHIKSYDKIKEIAVRFLEGPDKTKFLSVMGDILKAQKDFQGAIEYYKQYLSHLGMNIHVLNALGESHFKLKQYEQALQVLEKSLMEDPKQKKIADFIKQIKRSQSDKNKQNDK